MLIEFSVENYRSIREKQTLNMVAQNADHTLPENRIDESFKGIKDLRFLKGAAIYGPNASGKTNVVLALAMFRAFVGNYSSRFRGGETGTLHVPPFGLDAKGLHNPTRFSIALIADDNVRYEYSLAVTPERIVEESLTAYPKGLAQHWFQRTYVDETKDYTWEHASSFRFDRSLADKTRPDTTFLVVCEYFNQTQTAPIVRWFSSVLQLTPLPHRYRLSYDTTCTELLGGQHNAIMTAFEKADVGIAEANIEVSEGKYKVRFLHKGSEGHELWLEHDEESAGTQRYFSLLGPWLRALAKGEVLIIDEIETSLHPFLVRELLRLFMSNEHNPKRAQIIFTTHNPLLLDTSLLRRDQIWFTEKDRSGATTLYPLTDFKPRNDEALLRGYLAGRYGGVPFIPEGLL